MTLHIDSEVELQFDALDALAVHDAWTACDEAAAKLDEARRAGRRTGTLRAAYFATVQAANRLTDSIYA